MSDKTIHDFIADKLNDLKDRYIAKNPTGFSAFEAQEARKEQIVRQFRLLQSRAEDSQLNVQILSEKDGTIREADIARSIYFSARDGQSGLSDIRSVAAQLAGAFVTKHHWDEIVKIARAEAEEARANFEKFKKENRETLRELGLV